MMKMAIRSASAGWQVADFWGRTGLYRLEYQSGLPAGRLRLYGAPVGFQRSHVPADHDLSLPDAGDR